MIPRLGCRDRRWGNEMPDLYSLALALFLAMH